jgi:hypothetical protein
MSDVPNTAGRFSLIDSPFVSRCHRGAALITLLGSETGNDRAYVPAPIDASPADLVELVAGVSAALGQAFVLRHVYQVSNLAGALRTLEATLDQATTPTAPSRSLH